MMSMVRPRVSLASLVACASIGLAAASGSLHVAGSRGNLLATRGACATWTVSSGQNFSFNLQDAESGDGHYNVSVRSEVEYNATDIEFNATFYFQCTRVRPTLSAPHLQSYLPTAPARAFPRHVVKLKCLRTSRCHLTRCTSSSPSSSPSPSLRTHATTATTRQSARTWSSRHRSRGPTAVTPPTPPRTVRSSASRKTRRGAVRGARPWCPSPRACTRGRRGARAWAGSNWRAWRSWTTPTRPRGSRTPSPAESLQARNLPTGRAPARLPTAGNQPRLKTPIATTPRAPDTDAK